MEPAISIRKFAKDVGVAEATVRRAIAAGKIVRGVVHNPKTGRPGIIRSIADREWEAAYTGKTNASPVLKERYGFTSGGTAQASSVDVKLGQSSAGTNVSDDEQDQDDSGAIKNPKTMRDAQLKEQIYKANMAEIKYNEALGKLVKKEKVYKAFFEFGTQVREAIQSVPDRVVDLMLACTSRNEAHELLSSELARALETLSNYKNTEKTADEDEA